MTKMSPFSFLTGEMKPKNKQSKKKRRERAKAPLTRRQRIRQVVRERMLQAKAAAIEV